MKAPPAAGIPAPPEFGQYVEVLPEILWLRLPVPGPLQHINVWLLPGERGWILVDTGFRHPDVVTAWESLHAQLPLARELESLLVTHFHPDHMGMAASLAERHGVPVHATPQTLAAAHHALAPDDRQQQQDIDAFASHYGVELDAAMRELLSWKSYGRMVSGAPAATVALADGQRLTTRQTDWRVSVHHGHAPGHACLHSAALGVLVSGDQILPRISSNVSLFPGNVAGNPLGEYLHSLQRLAELPGDTLVLPAHGLPFRTLHARLAAVRDEHVMRCASIEEFCSEPRSTHELASRLFRYGWLDPLNRMLAVGETLAHARQLECDGRLRREGQGGALRWLA